MVIRKRGKKVAPNAGKRAAPATPAKPGKSAAPRAAARPAAKPVAKPAAKPAAKPVAKPTARPATKSAAKPAARPAVKPPAKGPARPVAKGAVRVAAAAPKDDAAKRKLQLLEQEKTELQDLGREMKAERDSALAETERLRDRVRELENQQARQANAEPSPAGPGGFDPAVDLDEDIQANTEDDLEGTAGFFDRMDEIRARRNELDRERNDRELEQSDQSFWMICPKCGDLLEESEGENVKLERCETCGGLYLDRGEVDLILSLCTGPEGYRRLHNILKF